MRITGAKLYVYRQRYITPGSRQVWRGEFTLSLLTNQKIVILSK